MENNSPEESKLETNEPVKKRAPRRVSTRAQKPENDTDSSVIDNSENKQSSSGASVDVADLENSITAKKSTRSRKTTASTKTSTKTKSDADDAVSENALVADSTTAAQSNPAADVDAEAEIKKPSRRRTVKKKTEATLDAENKSSDSASLKTSSANTNSVLASNGEEKIDLNQILSDVTPGNKNNSRKSSVQEENIDADNKKELSLDQIIQLPEGPHTPTDPEAYKSKNKSRKNSADLENIAEVEDSPRNRNRNNRGASPVELDLTDDNKNIREDSRNRTRNSRDRKRRNGEDELILSDDDVLIPIAGIVDVLDNYAFVRTGGYLPGGHDVYVSLGQVKKYQLRKGDAIMGAIRQPKEGEQMGRQKYNALVKLDSINGVLTSQIGERPVYDQLLALDPEVALPLSGTATSPIAQAIDTVSPIALGQRVLVKAPFNGGVAKVIELVTASLPVRVPDAHLMLVSIDERPERIRQWQQSVKGEVITTSFDRGPEDHAMVADLAIERAKRLAELGYDVVLIIDSVTRLARAHTQIMNQSHRVKIDDADVNAYVSSKKIFAAARNAENYGSLTVICTAESDANSGFDYQLIKELERLSSAVITLDAQNIDSPVFVKEKSWSRDGASAKPLARSL